MQETSPTATDREVISVSQLNRQVKRLLEDGLPALWVSGEISNFAAPRSGHWYFTLKDELAQVRCAMFRGRNARTGFTPEDGMQVTVRARAGLYEVRGEYQLIVDQMEAAGSGALQMAFERLRAKLQAEGLFDADRKQPVPSWPGVVGVVTSPTGAALQDILSVMGRRFPATRIRVFPASVQGQGAARELVSAIRRADRDPLCEVLIVGRGGGSLEDLWPFNEEQVARAVHACSKPVVSAVGHEVDFTICDFVADLRAPTPSAAAELLTPDQLEVAGEVIAWRAALGSRMQRRLQQLRAGLAMLRSRLRHPRQVLQERGQHLDHLEIRLLHAQRRQLQAQRTRLQQLAHRMQVASPRHTVRSARQQLGHLRSNLQHAMDSNLSARRNRFALQAAALEQVSPLATLARGYAVLTDQQGGLVRGVGQLRTNDRVTARLVNGSADLKVEGVMEDK